MAVSDLGDLAAYLDAQEREALARRNGGSESSASQSVDGALRERLDDHLRTEQLASALREARATGDAGERARMRLRGLGRAFVDRASAAVERAIAEREREIDPPACGFEAALALCEDPVERVRIHRSWVDHEERLAELRCERDRCREQAARSVGAASLGALLRAGHPGDPAALVATFERGAIAPLDEAVGSATRERRLSSRLALSEPPQSADTPVLAALSDYRDHAPRRTVPALLRQVGAQLEQDPDTDGPRLVREVNDRAWSEILVISGARPVMVLGAVDGPVALGRDLATLGRAVRAQFVGRLRGPAAARWSDPAFAVGAGTLFRRLLLSSSFRERRGLGFPAPLISALSLEEALAPRRSWAYLFLATGPHGVDFRVVDDLLTRTTGRRALPDARRPVHDRDPVGAAELRGTVYGLLLEERLLSRFGRAWLDSPRARAYLRECWEAESDGNAEDVAASLDIGTIDATPLLDRCRP